MQRDAEPLREGDSELALSSQRTARQDITHLVTCIQQSTARKRALMESLEVLNKRRCVEHDELATLSVGISALEGALKHKMAVNYAMGQPAGPYQEIERTGQPRALPSQPQLTIDRPCLPASSAPVQTTPSVELVPSENGCVREVSPSTETPDCDRIESPYDRTRILSVLGAIQSSSCARIFKQIPTKKAWPRYADAEAQGRIVTKLPSSILSKDADSYTPCLASITLAVRNQHLKTISDVREALRIVWKNGFMASPDAEMHDYDVAGTRHSIERVMALESDLFADLEGGRLPRLSDATEPFDHIMARDYLRALFHCSGVCSAYKTYPAAWKHYMEILKSSGRPLILVSDILKKLASAPRSKKKGVYTSIEQLLQEVSSACSNLHHYQIVAHGGPNEAELAAHNAATEGILALENHLTCDYNERLAWMNSFAQ